MNFFNDLVDIDIEKNMGFYNMTDEFFCLLINKIQKSKNKNIVVVVNNLYDANKLYSSLLNYNDDVVLFPMDDFLTSEALAISPDLMVNRLVTMNNIINNDAKVVITNLMGYLRFLPKKDDYFNFMIKIKVGDIISPKHLVRKLISCGYSRDSIVNKTGEYGERGFIVDVYPIEEEFPVRIEFFDDEIESIRFFDVVSQKSIKKVDFIIINPYSEFLTYKDVENSHYGRQKYLQLYEQVDNISSYFDECITIYKDYEQLKMNYSKILNEIDGFRKEKDLNFKNDYMFKIDQLNVFFPIYYYSLNNVNFDIMNKYFDFDVKIIHNFDENVDSVNKFISENKKNGKTIIICLKKYQIRSVLKYLKIKTIRTTFDNIIIGEVNVVEGEMNEGFIYKDIVLITANELFNNIEKSKKYVTNFKYSSNIMDINKISVGDYVVHNIHGIGIYNGIKSLEFNGIVKDYLEILYFGSDKIYIPVEKIDLLCKYSGREGVLPKISRLGGSEWKRTKYRVKEKVADMANKLLDLYAKREAKKGFSFSEDCDMLLDFEKDFSYELTADQKKSIFQIKKDMESSIPMDRLLCGDVGFGKTEVAFVAAFKAVLDSKQVLFLCPTTILSNQHYNSALVRFKNFPVNIELLNRFTSHKDTLRILSGLKDGSVDIVFGTHRLLSNDVQFKDLGLLIIDEEQRFGVAHKEKIKQYKNNIDVLTLTATPIPRTLQMSLVGIRSLSLIETPPVDRYPIQTYVLEESEQIVKDAINKELSRDGQVFIIYNRVKTISLFSDKIKKIVPSARIGIAHGQMNKNELEDTIYNFVNYKFDILICTTIIETGIDIPNVNTLIVYDADRFGLSQLYQIRGRVGRSNKFAYAYLMYHPSKILTDTAAKRLKVLKDFTELGSGFAIASRDLSIRGAGDILGVEQAGFIDSVGVDLYLKMLNDEINRINNNMHDDEVINAEIEMNNHALINVTTHIDDSYVADTDLKIEIHRKINSIFDENSFNQIKCELEDRFGRLNDDLIIYMYEEWFEKLAKKLNLSDIHQNKNSIEIVIPEKIIMKISIDELFVDVYSISKMFRFLSKGNNLIIVLDIIKLDRHPIYYLVSLLNLILVKFENFVD